MAKKKIVGGTEGAIDAPGFNVNLDSWSMNIETGEATDRTFESEWEDHEITSFRGRGSFRGTIEYDDTDTAPLPTEAGGGINASAFKEVACTLTDTTGCNYTGTINITRFGTTRDTGTFQKGEYQFAFKGQPSQTWDETSA